MSLLMDALKKAELAKRQGQAEGAADAAPAEGLSLEPLGNAPAAAPAAGEQLPNLPSRLEELDAQFLAEAKRDAARPRRPAANGTADAVAERVEPAAARANPTPAARRAAAREEPAQAAAQNLFAAKQTAAPVARRSFAITVGLLTVVAIGAIGGYFWWQLQPKTPSLAARSAPVPPPAALPPPKPVAVAPAPTLPAAAPAAGQATQAKAAGAAAAAEDDSIEKPPVKSATRPAAPSQRAATPPALPAPVADGERLLRVTRAPLKVNPALMRGFDAFGRGDLDLAQMEYERARKADPRNTDALHGLAAIAQRQGRAEEADALYRQVLENDPQDSIAAAALVNSARSQADPAASESRLKSLAANQPELAAPHFALGNLLARQGRWSEAQQAYFKAYSAEPENPDILYNLAISLEHLRQNKLAAQYYALAIAAAKNHPAGFDTARAAARLPTLQP